MCRFVGGVVQTLTKFKRVTWVHKILVGIKKNGRGLNFGVGEILAPTPS